MLFRQGAGSGEQGRADEFIACILGMLEGGYEWEGLAILVLWKRIGCRLTGLESAVMHLRHTHGLRIMLGYNSEHI